MMKSKVLSGSAKRKKKEKQTKNILLTNKKINSLFRCIRPGNDKEANGLAESQSDTTLQENLLDISTNCGIEEKLIEEANGSAESQSDIVPHENLLDINTNYKNFNRHLTLAMFTRSLPSGQKCNRKWLLYSPSQGSVYCFVCKLYESYRENPFISGGFDKWKKSERIGEHENCQQHRNDINKWLLRSNTNNAVNKDLCRQITAETNYWFEVMKRL
ncbi:zinc finger MYM-type protein 5-like [Aphis gossypii]|uniref:zinc finger MYM-type protein 5-like n=1 Tax=Aphis gossypii TaxID=80765 RepID=UPI002158B162|nr:zinc finger MYM-type protein 5-like [Aphis gossypii]